MLCSRVKNLVISAVFLLPASAAIAQTTQPAAGIAAPTTQAVPVDQSTPRGALKSLVTAMQMGDTAKIKSVIATTNPTEDKMVDAMSAMSTAQKHFRTAAQAAYGDSAKDLTGDTEAGMAEGLAKIDAAPETIDGNIATVDPTGAPGVPPMKLTKVDGMWRIPIGELARGVDQNAIQQRLDDLSSMSKLMDESADEVSKGMYKTPKDAGEAIKSKMMVAMMKRANAATQATTEPSAPPMDAPPPAPSTPGM